MYVFMYLLTVGYKVTLSLSLGGWLGLCYTEK